MNIFGRPSQEEKVSSVKVFGRNCLKCLKSSKGATVVGVA